MLRSVLREVAREERFRLCWEVPRPRRWEAEAEKELVAEEGEGEGAGARLSGLGGFCRS